MTDDRDGTPAPDAEPGALITAAVEASYNSVIITNAELTPPGPRIVYVNPAFEAMTGYAAAEVLGRSPRLLQGERSDPAVLDRLRGALSRLERFEGGDHQLPA